MSYTGLNEATIVIRLAGDGDRGELRRLAELDSAAPLREPAWLAIVDGRPAAAYSLTEGRAVADPWQRTAALVELLRDHCRPAATGRTATANRRPGRVLGSLLARLAGGASARASHAGRAKAAR